MSSSFINVPPSASNFTEELPGNGSTSKVLVIYTGGTIGMIKNQKEVLVPAKNVLKKIMLNDPQLHDTSFQNEKKYLVLPHVEGMKRVLYFIVEYENLLDSSNMTMEDWTTIANDIYQNYEEFDGFVILHGTDTLAYTASALSFMLENLGKSVVLTGSQIPLFEPRNDGKDNFVCSLLLAGNFIIPEVTIFFNHKLFRGNRTMKSSTNEFDAFYSYNVPPLATVGIQFEVDHRSILQPCTVAKFTVHSELNHNVGLLRIFPSIPQKILSAFLQPPVEGVVIQTFGAGNMPSNREDLILEMKKATDQGVIIVNCTQCLTGSVTDLYETGKAFINAGVIMGADMTPEAALAKLAYVLSKKEWDLSTKRAMMSTSLRGELTVKNVTNSLQEFDLINSVARSLHLNTPQEKFELGSILYPAMLCATVKKKDIQKLTELKDNGADVNAVNADSRTPLHIACCEGDLDVVHYLLKNGASVHMKDRYGQTPLMDAIRFDSHDVIELLRRNGAHLTNTSTDIGTALCRATANGQIKRLESFHLAGADLSTPGADGRTALHEAVLHGNKTIMVYLLQANANTNIKDLLGYAPIDIAMRLSDSAIINLLAPKNI